MQKLYVVYDTTAQTIEGPIWAQKHDGPAVRAFHALLADKQTMPGRYPEQYDLLGLGYINEETGQIDPLSRPETITTGAAWKTANTP